MIKLFTSLKSSRVALATIVAFFLLARAYAQVSETLHWIVPADSVPRIELGIVDSLEVLNWYGNQIMVTSEITVFDAPRSILNHFVNEEHRYEVIDTSYRAEVLSLVSRWQKRPPIRVKGKTCYEQVKVKVYLPMYYRRESEQAWVIRDGK